MPSSIRRGVHLDPRAALQEWQPAYKRGAAMQATLALVGFVLAATAAFLGAGTLVALGAAFIIAPWPWTFLAIMPLNKRLLAMTVDEARLVPTCIRCLTVGTRCIVSARCSARRPQPACSGHRSGCSAMLGTGDDEDYEFNTKARSSEDDTKKSTMLARRRKAGVGWRRGEGPVRAPSETAALSPSLPLSSTHRATRGASIEVLQ